MTVSVNNITLQSEDGTVTVKGDGMTLEVSEDGIKFSLKGDENSWDADSITEITTKSEDDNFLLIIHSDEEETLFSTDEELHLLNAAEAIASLFSIRLSEHTGRWVEGDEHGMNVIEQIQSFPERWPHSNAEGTPLMKVNRVGSIIQFTIPSELEKTTYWLFIGAVAIAVIIGTQINISSDSYLMSLLVSLLPVLMVIAVFVVLSIKSDLLVANHSIAMNESGVYIQPKFLGIFGLPSVQHTLNEFKDLDLTDSGSITFLFGDRRMSLKLEDRYQAEWILAEIVDAISLSNLANS
jgi:hypothetical protein